MSAFVSNICFPVTGQNIVLAKQQFPHIAKLDLAEQKMGNEPLEIDVLIGANYYWELMTDDPITKAQKAQLQFQ